MITTEFLAGGADVALQAGGVQVARAEGYSVTATRPLRDIASYGEGVAARLPGSAAYLITLSRVLPAAGAAPDFFSLSNFTVTVTDAERIVSYTGCEWSEIRQETSCERIAECITLSASGREVTLLG